MLISPRPPEYQNDYELSGYTPFMSGFAASQNEFGLPVDVQRATRRSTARRALALELQFEPSLRPNKPPTAPTTAEAKLICPDWAAHNASVKQLVGRCDKVFRTSSAAHAGLPKEAWPAVRGTFFEEAAQCFRPVEVQDTSGDAFEDPNFVINFAAFTEAICGKTVPEDAYGVPGDVIKLGLECGRQVRLALKYTNELLDEVKRTRVLGTPAVVHSYADALTKLDAALEHRSLFQVNGDLVNAMYQKMEARELSLKSAHSSFQLLKARVNSHVTRRVAEEHSHLQQMDDDVFARMAQCLDSNAAVALMSVCVEYSRTEALRERVPHMHVRCLVGNFPHQRASSRDREALAKNQTKPVLRDFVVARQAVRLYVDFVIPTVRTVPLKKKDRTDGLSNIDHDFSDDEYEEPPESLRLRGPQVSLADTTTEWGRRQADAQQRRRSLWAAAEGPEEKHDRYVYNKRIPHDTYFASPLQITPCLVYADTKEPVSCPRYKQGLDLSNQLLRDGGHFSQPPNWTASDQMPAAAKFHVPHLSLDHGGRLFRLRLIGTSTLLHTGNPFSQVVYTEPFEVVSKPAVVKQASKRRTVEQVREDARKRAKAKAKSV